MLDRGGSDYCNTNSIKGNNMNNTAHIVTPTQDQLDELETLAHTGPRPRSASEADALLRYMIDRITPPTELAPLAGDCREALYLAGF